MKTIAIDFDGVIHRYRDGWQDGTIYDVPVEGAFEAIEILMKHYAVFIHTTRKPESVLAWLGRWMLRKDYKAEIVPDHTLFWDKQYVVGITNRKLPAIAYIDDRGIRFTNWKDMLNYF